MYACCICVCYLKTIACWLFLFNVMFKPFIYSSFQKCNVKFTLLLRFLFMLERSTLIIILPRQKLWMWENCEWAFSWSWRSISLRRRERITMENFFFTVLPTSPFHLLNTLKYLPECEELGKLINFLPYSMQVHHVCKHCTIDKILCNLLIYRLW